MTQDEIIRMARDAGLYNVKYPTTSEIERFAALVAKATKAQLFKELMDMHRTANGQHNYYQYAVIQLRGEPV